MKSLERVVSEISRVLRDIQEFLPRAGSLERLLLPGEVAELLRVSQDTLENWRCRGIGPSYLKFGKRDVRYRPSDVLRWLDERVSRSTWKYAEPAA